MSLKDLLQKLGILTQKVEALEKNQTLKPKQENENTTDENSGGESGSAEGNENNGSEGNSGEGGEGNSGSEGDGEGEGAEENQELAQALELVSGLTQRVEGLETTVSNYKANLDKQFKARVDAAAKEQLASSAGTPLQTGPGGKEELGGKGTQGLKGRALQVAKLKEESKKA